MENIDIEKMRWVYVQAVVIAVVGFWPALLVNLSITTGSRMLVNSAKIAKTRLARLPSRTASSMIFA